MNLIEFLNELKNKEIQLNFVNGKIRYSGPEHQITSQILQNIKENKEALIKYFWTFEKSNLIPVSMTGTKTPLVIVHGGEAANFLPEFFKHERPIVNYLDLGSDGEKIKFKNIDSLARHYIANLKKLIPHGPYILCGFSFGGLMASKMTEILQKEYNDKIPFIILFDTQTPQATFPEGPNKIYKLTHLIEENKVIFLLKALWKRIRRLKKLPRIIHLYKVWFLFNKPIPPRYRNKYILWVYTMLSKSYEPARIETDLLLFKSMESDGTYAESNLGWDGKMNNIETILLEGDHLQMISLEENFEIIADKIRVYFNKHEN